MGGCSGFLPSGFFSAEERAIVLSLGPLEEPPEDTTNGVALDGRAIALGQTLFFEPRLSLDGSVSCATCHDPGHGFAGPVELARGLGDTARHAPSLWNVAWGRWFNWDGGTDSAWAQALGPLEHPSEMGSDRLSIAHVIASDPTLREPWEELFGALPPLEDGARFPDRARPARGGVDDDLSAAWDAMAAEDRDEITLLFTRVGKVIAAYEGQLRSGVSRFDHFRDALARPGAVPLEPLGEQALEGLKLFVGKAGCFLCHSGPAFTDFEFHNLGLGARPWLAEGDRGRYTGVEDLLASPFSAVGRWSDDVEGAAAQRLQFLRHDVEEQEGQFKTPTLRNVALSPPYMHGGHLETLEDVVRFYSDLDEEGPALGHREESLLPLALDDAEVEQLVAFLEALTDEG